MMTRRKPKSLNPKNIFEFITKEERRGSVVLLVAAIAALVIANSALADTYYSFFDRILTVGSVSLDLQHWINEGLMAVFFLVVGLEVKREFVDGELRTWRRAALPVVAAIGGMLMPALFFTVLNPYPPQSTGWAIPMATDIAIAVGVLGILGNRVPKSLRVFLLTLAIVDDIGSIVVISLFYNQPSNMFALLLALVVALVLAVLRRRRYWPVIFAVLGLAIWYCLLLAGVSGTLAGVIIALLMPLSRSAHRLQTAEIIEDVLIPLASFVIVPLFVFANAGITLADVMLRGNGSMSVFLGVLLGLVIGKPLGIVGASWFCHVSKIAQKPDNISWRQLSGVGLVAGIGFTISLLIAGLAYESSSLLHDAATLGIFGASMISGVAGLVVLSLAKDRSRA